jgi:hypothetical protein
LPLVQRAQVKRKMSIELAFVGFCMLMGLMGHWVALPVQVCVMTLATRPDVAVYALAALVIDNWCDSWIVSGALAYTVTIVSDYAHHRFILHGERFLTSHFVPSNLRGQTYAHIVGHHKLPEPTGNIRHSVLATAMSITEGGSKTRTWLAVSVHVLTYVYLPTFTVVLGLGNARALLYLAAMIIPAFLFSNHQWMHRAPFGLAGVARRHRVHHADVNCNYALEVGHFARIKVAKESNRLLDPVTSSTKIVTSPQF